VKSTAPLIVVHPLLTRLSQEPARAPGWSCAKRCSATRAQPVAATTAAPARLPGRHAVWRKCPFVGNPCCRHGVVRKTPSWLGAPAARWHGILDRYGHLLPGETDTLRAMARNGEASTIARANVVALDARRRSPRHSW